MTATEPAPAPLGLRALRELEATDLAVYRAIAASPTPTLDTALKRLSRTADHSLLWLSIAGVLAVVPGAPRRAALLGVASIGVASTTANVVAKTLVRRRRPDRDAAAVPAGRHVRMPTSTSLPSGHAASGFAFVGAVSGQLPWASLPLNLLATAVAYSRVHTGAHYPADTVLGASIGTASAALTTRVANRLMRGSTRPRRPA